MGPDAPISTLMRAPVVTVTPAQRLHDVCRLMRDHGLHHVPVVDDDGRLLGMISATDLLALGPPELVRDPDAVAALLDRRHTVAEVMRRDLVVLGHDRSVRHAAALLRRGTYHALPIVGPAGDLRGIITSGDLLAYLAALPSDPAALLRG